MLMSAGVVEKPKHKGPQSASAKLAAIQVQPTTVPSDAATDYDDAAALQDEVMKPDPYSGQPEQS